MRGLKTFVRQYLLAPRATTVLSGLLRRGVHYRGRYRDWAQASAAAEGYDDPTILDRVAATTQAVVRGEIPAERDGYPLTTRPDNHALIAALLHSAGGGRLRVVDFGGGLGSLYHATRPWLEPLGDLDWCVVEQAHYAQRGTQDFADGRLRFSDDLDEVLAQGTPDIVLLSGVLQFLPDPLAVLRQVAASGAGAIFLDRVPFWPGPTSRITIQYVPSSIVKTNYPSHLFARAELLAPLTSEYQCLSTFSSIEGAIFGLGRVVPFEGALFLQRHSKE